MVHFDKGILPALSVTWEHNFSASNYNFFKMNIEEIQKTLPGWCSPAKAQALIDMTVKHPKPTYVEVGVFGGRSFIPVGLAVKQAGGRAFAIDPWTVEAAIDGEVQEHVDWWSKSVDLEKTYLGFVNALGSHDLLLMTEVWRKTSETACFQWLQTRGPESITSCYVDGNHSHKHALADAQRWLPLVKVGGAIALDDVEERPGVKPAHEWLSIQCSFQGIVDGAAFYTKEK